MTHPTPNFEETIPNKIKEFFEGTKDLPTIENKEGGLQSDTFGRFDLIPPEALITLAKVLDVGAKKYGENNWHKIELKDHINHAFEHLVFYLKNDSSEDHLAHCLTRLTFAVWARENRKEVRNQEFREVPIVPINEIEREEGLNQAENIRQKEFEDLKAVYEKREKEILQLSQVDKDSIKNLVESGPINLTYRNRIHSSK